MADQKPTKPTVPYDEMEILHQGQEALASMPEGERKEKVKSFLRFKIGKLMEDYDPPADPHGMLDKIADAGLRGIDYGAGIIRTAAITPVQMAYHAATGKTFEKPDDVERTLLKGDAPTFAEYADRLGIPKGPSLSDVPGISRLYEGDTWHLNKGGMLDPTVRGAVTGLLDVGAGLGQIARRAGTGIEKGLLKAGASDGFAAGGKTLTRFALNPIDLAMDKGGQAYYESAFNGGVKDALEEGKPPATGLLKQSNIRPRPNPATLLREDGVRGLGGFLTADGLSSRIDQLVDRLSANANLMTGNADSEAARLRGLPVSNPQTVSRVRAADRGRKVIRDARNTLGSAAGVDSAESTFERAVQPGAGVPLVGFSQAEADRDQLMKMLRALGGFLPPTEQVSGNAVNAVEKGTLKQALKSTTTDLADQVEHGMNQLPSGGNKGTAYRDIGLKQASLITAKEGVDRAPRGILQSLTSPARALSTGAGLGAYVLGTGMNDAKAIPAALALAGAYALGSTPAKLVGGSIIHGSAPYASSAIRAGLLDKFGDSLRGDTDWEKFMKDLKAKGDK